jgi:hypothetical protein
MPNLPMLPLLIVLALAGNAFAGAAADTNLEVLRDTIRANKKALIAANLKLTDDEAGKFWGIYERYEKDLKGVNDRLVALIDDYTKSFKGLSDEKAQKLVQDYLTVEEDRTKLRRDYLDDFTGALPGKKVARFYQIENKMDAVIRYDLAAEIPVVEE